MIDKDGIPADPKKTSAISYMEPPQSISDLRRFMELANRLGSGDSCQLEPFKYWIVFARVLFRL